MDAYDTLNDILKKYRMDSPAYGAFTGLARSTLKAMEKSQLERILEEQRSWIESDIGGIPTLAQESHKRLRDYEKARTMNVMQEVVDIGAVWKAFGTDEAIRFSDELSTTYQALNSLSIAQRMAADIGSASKEFDIDRMMGLSNDLGSTQRLLDALNRLPTSFHQLVVDQMSQVIDNLVETELPPQVMYAGETAAVSIVERIQFTDELGNSYVNEEPQNLKEFIRDIMVPSKLRPFWDKYPGFRILVVLYYVVVAATLAESLLELRDRATAEQVQPQLVQHIENHIVLFGKTDPSISKYMKLAFKSLGSTFEYNKAADKYIGFVNTKHSALTVRSRPNAKAESIGAIPRRDPLIILEKGFFDRHGKFNRSWWRIKYASDPEAKPIVGWVFARYIKTKNK